MDEQSPQEIADEYAWALWRLLCGHSVIGAADTHENSGQLYCGICCRTAAVTERTAWVIRIRQEDRLKVEPA